MDSLKLNKKERNSKENVFSIFRNQDIAIANTYLLLDLVLTIIMRLDLKPVVIILMIAQIFGIVGNVCKKSKISIMSIIILCIGSVICIYMLITNNTIDLYRRRYSQIARYFFSLYLTYNAMIQIKSIEKNKKQSKTMNWFYEENN